ncbi:hypothetical protein K435DRAFT_874907 [Dendrothele bispora CBS 962.96]|uniref:Fungal N-terminal domain-containing protein n=1 Tax=Dendrothele bispora (strain CBS 962.96) TaxID=1314807 RepID=A0A4S8KWL8_DENBC|nr:hypothetical protein K435DRAFT_874907 [Dendrothele bispora CBS 962.96]
MNALTNLQPSLNLSSQSDNTQSEVTSTITYHTPVVLVALLVTVVLLVLRLRYPCLTLSELGRFVDQLNDTIQKCNVEGQRRDFMDRVCIIQRKIDEIEDEWSRKAIFRWSLVYGYLRASLIAVRDIVKCYDRAQALRVSVLTVIAHERRVRDDIENQYHHMLNSEENHRRDTNADADTGSFSWITSPLQSFRIPGQGDKRSD